MNEEQKKRFIIFLTDFECTIKDFKEFLGEKEKVSNIVLKTFIEGLQNIIKDLKQDIDFLNCSELSFDTENTEKAYINNFVMCAESDNKSFLECISNKENIVFKDYNVFLGDFLCKIRNLKQNVKFLQCDYELVINIEREEID